MRELLKHYTLEIGVLLCLVVLFSQLGMMSHRMAMKKPERRVVKRVIPKGVVIENEFVDSRFIAERLVDAIIQVESGGRARKVGSAGERGIMQIKRSTWKQTTRQLFGKTISFNKAFDPSVNRRVGRGYLAHLQNFLQAHKSEWKSDERSLLLACYNAGPQRVKKAGFNIRRLPRSTRSYVRRATALHNYFLAEQAPLVKSLLAGGAKPDDREKNG